MNNLNFKAALIALEQGKRVAREGWNGKGLYIFKQVPAIIDTDVTVPKMQSLPNSVKTEIKSRLMYGKEIFPDVDPIEFNAIKYENQMCIMYPDNILYGYSPSTSDVLAEDWTILDIDIDTQDIKRNKDWGGLDFGTAVEVLKKGGKAWRKGWNGQDMFLYFVPAASYPAMTGIAKEFFGDTLVPYRQYLALKTAQGDVATWSPSNSDIFEKDWYVTENQTEVKPIAEETFKDRLIKERDDLILKNEKLGDFLSGGDLSKIKPSQVSLLRIQYSAMLTYLRCLQERLLTL
jgi:hypothetical protein